MRIGLAGVDLDGILKTLDGVGVIAALLVDESELILRLAVVRIQGRRLQHAAERLAMPHSGAEIGELAAQEVPRVEEKERRSEIAYQVSQRHPQKDGGHQRNPRE